jgi:hypothetical protein
MDSSTQVPVLLVAALIVAPLFKRLGVGSVLGYLAAGLLIRPRGLRLSGGTEALQQFAAIGVVPLPFVIGPLARRAAVYKDAKAFRQSTIDAAQELKESFTEDAVLLERGTFEDG